MTNKYLIFIILMIPTILMAQEMDYHHPASVTEALEKAGENRPELEKVLEHYIQKNETLKLMAAYYLIENMEGHSYVQVALYDSLENEVPYDVLDYPDFKALVAALDSLEAEKGELSWDKKELKEDLQYITAGFLIENIDLAFEAWQTKPWANHLNFAQFCDYVLPYRGSNEPLESWRPYFLEQFKNLADEMEYPRDPIEATKIINKSINSWFKFDERFYVHPTDQGLSEMLACKLGRCEDMTNLAIYAMRANGLAVTSDYTPHWADTGNNHAWNSIMDKDGKVVPFMGGESSPGDYNLNHKLAKAYRKRYAKNKNNLVFQKEEWEKVPRWLGGKNYVDVTADYENVCHVQITLEKPVPDSVNFAYLCVFNSGDWRAIHWGEIQGDTVTFTDMGKDIAYLPMYYVNEELIPAGSPFILQSDGSIRSLKANQNAKSSISLNSTTQRKLAEATDGIEQTFLSVGTEYELFYWQDPWQSIGIQIASEKPLQFEGVPQNGLYWLVAKDSKKDERIFTLENSHQIWW